LSNVKVLLTSVKISFIVKALSIKEYGMERLNWRSLNAIINDKTEEEVLELLNHERQTERRISMLQRLHQRYTILRAARERVEIIKEAIRP
jgi:hypothetical protein